MNPRSIATQGLGRSTRLVAVQGLWPDPAFSGGGFRPRRVNLPRADRTSADSDALLLAATLAAGLGVLQ
ncbi:MAG: hypothetical protein KAY54_03650 [Burkholderiaceae bacterium]|nr:hypothetical protein [Burkholderiaceae bacterium]